ncbi:hypothetical protein ACWPKO_00620 [Coraliomargarita sp. W4R53]
MDMAEMNAHQSPYHEIKLDVAAANNLAPLNLHMANSDETMVRTHPSGTSHECSIRFSKKAPQNMMNKTPANGSSRTGDFFFLN